MMVGMPAIFTKSSFHSRCMPALIRSFIRSYLEATLVSMIHHTRVIVDREGRA